MLKHNIKILVILSLAVPNLFGQSYFIDNKVNSPYSRFGLGDLYQSTFSPVKAMGGAGIALRESNLTNNINAASYSLFDTLSFVFDFGIRSTTAQLSSGEQQVNTSNSNLDHITIGFGINKRWGASIGLVPYSKKAYNVIKTGETADSSDYLTRLGKGEINKLYFGTAFDIAQNTSIGVNASYLFGKMENSKSLKFPGDINSAITYGEKQEYFTHGLVFDFGLQHTINLNNNNLSFGLTYQPNKEINSNVYLSDSAEYPLNSKSVIYNTDTFSAKTTIPAKLGLGVAFQLKDNLLFAFDYKTQDWTGAKIADVADPYLTKSQAFNIGAQIIPDPNSVTHYIKRIKYRLGAYYTETPIKIENEHIKDLGISAGMGLPFKNTKTSFNISAELGKRGINTSTLIEEKYIKVNINVSFHDFWFYRPGIE